MKLAEAQKVCMEIDWENRNYDGIHVKWTTVVPTEEALLNLIKNIYVPKRKEAPRNTFRGYEYIYHFAETLQAGRLLSPAQMRQAKRLALEILKAYSINEYVIGVDKGVEQ